MASTSQEEFGRAVAENILAFDRDFWMRLAARADTAASDADKQQLASLASSVMTLMDAMVRQTEVQLSGSGEVVQDLMRAGAEPNGEWLVPLPAERVDAIRQAMAERQDSLDEALLSTCFAYMKKASDDGLDGLVHVLQTILQLYAAQAIAQQDAPSNLGGDGEDDPVDTRRGEDSLVTDICAAGPSAWDHMIESFADADELSEASFSAAVQRKMEATVLRLKSGSYAQRVQAEYLKELDDRGKAIFAHAVSSSSR